MGQITKVIDEGDAPSMSLRQGRSIPTPVDDVYLDLDLRDRKQGKTQEWA